MFIQVTKVNMKKERLLISAGLVAALVEVKKQDSLGKR
jgi:hypothetical protein